MLVTAVILNYYKERIPYLVPIVDSLMTGSKAPDKIIIWNNDPTANLPAFGYGDKVEVIPSCYNIGCFGRYLVSYSIPNGRCLFIDNDLIFGPYLLEQMMHTKDAVGADIVGIIGRKVYQNHPHPYLTSDITSGNVDIVVGRASLVSSFYARTIVQYAFSQKLTDHMFRCDDIIASCFALRGFKYVIKAQDGKDYFSLDEKNIGLSFDAQHYKVRDALVKELLAQGRFKQ